MSAVAEAFPSRWADEAAWYARHGDYAWLAETLAAALGAADQRRVVEVGCGVGESTVVLARAGFSVCVVEPIAACRDEAAQRLAAAGAEIAGRVTFIDADVTALPDAARRQLEAFDPRAVACWLAGAPDEVTALPGGRPGEGVARHRETMQRGCAELAAALPGVTVLQVADRTVMPWAAKDIGRDLTLKVQQQLVLKDLPFQLSKADTLFRKLTPTPHEAATLGKLSGPMRGAIPLLGMALARRA